MESVSLKLSLFSRHESKPMVTRYNESSVDNSCRSDAMCPMTTFLIQEAESS
jgi:hypothetical protein